MALAQKYGVEIPIIEAVNRVLFENRPVREEVMALMQRDKRVENQSLHWE